MSDEQHRPVELGVLQVAGASEGLALCDTDPVSMPCHGREATRQQVTILSP